MLNANACVTPRLSRVASLSRALRCRRAIPSLFLSLRRPPTHSPPSSPKALSTGSSSLPWSPALRFPGECACPPSRLAHTSPAPWQQRRPLCQNLSLLSPRLRPSTHRRRRRHGWQQKSRTTRWRSSCSSALLASWAMGVRSNTRGGEHLPCTPTSSSPALTSRARFGKMVSKLLF